MATASVTLALNQSSFLAGMARAQSSVTALGASVGRIGSQAFVIAGAAALAFGTAAAVGIKKAFDLGGSLADMSAISGRSAKEILLLRRALEDAGISMEKIDRFILTGQDRGQVIARALKNMSSGDWADAAASVGKQADILNENAKTFDRVSDLLGRSGQKLQGFFVGAAGSIGKALLPILEKFDKLDFADQGAKFGQGLLLGAQALAGFFQKPELIFKVATDYFGAAIMGVGNVLISVFKTGIQFFRDGMLATFVSIGSALAATLLESFKEPMARLQAGFEELADRGPNERFLKFNIAANEKIRDAVGFNMSGQLNSAGRGIQAQIDDAKEKLKKAIPFEDRVAAIMKSGGPRLGFGEGQSAADFRSQATKESAVALDALATAVNGFKVEDILGVSEAMKKASMDIADAAKLGRGALPVAGSGGGGRNKGGGGFTFVPAGGGLTGGGATNFLGFDESMFRRNQMASDLGQWNASPQGAGKQPTRGDQLLESLNQKLDTLNITNKAQLQEWKGGTE